MEPSLQPCCCATTVRPLLAVSAVPGRTANALGRGGVCGTLNNASRDRRRKPEHSTCAHVAKRATVHKMLMCSSSLHAGREQELPPQLIGCDPCRPRERRAGKRKQRIVLVQCTGWFWAALRGLRRKKGGHSRQGSICWPIFCPNRAVSVHIASSHHLPPATRCHDAPVALTHQFTAHHSKMAALCSARAVSAAPVRAQKVAAAPRKSLAHVAAVLEACNMVLRHAGLLL